MVSWLLDSTTDMQCPKKSLTLRSMARSSWVFLTWKEKSRGRSHQKNIPSLRSSAAGRHSRFRFSARCRSSACARDAECAAPSSHMSIAFFRGSGLKHCWGGYAGGFAGPEFVEGLASRGFAARLWLRGVASPGFADVCSTNLAPPCC